MNNHRLNWIIIILIGITCLVFVFATWHSRANAIGEYKRELSNRDRELLNPKIMPTTENIYILKKDYEWLIEKERNLKDLLSNKNLSGGNLSPLEFKEELLSTQTKIKQLADIQGCTVQEFLGFQEYASGEIPAKEEVNLLTKQLTAINEIVNILLKYKISEIVSIVRAPAVYSGEGDLWKEIAFKLEIQCSMEELLGILKDITNSAYIFVVGNIKIDKINDAKLSVEILIAAIEFKE